MGATREYAFNVGVETSDLPNAGTPAVAADLATKEYVDDAISGVSSGGDSNRSAMTAENVGLAASVSGNALTIALKDRNGSDASGSSPVTIGFRSATIATGTPVIRNISSALSMTVSNGSSLGMTATVAGYIYVYAIDNAGTIELAVTYGNILDESRLITTTAEGGSGGADTMNLIYSTTSRSNVACRYLGKVFVAPAAAFAWSNSPTEISTIAPAPIGQMLYVAVNSAGKVGLTSGQFNDVGSLTVPAGTWLVSGYVSFYSGGATTSFTGCVAGVGTTSGNNDPNVGIDPVNGGLYESFQATVPNVGTFKNITLPAFTYVKSTSGTVYLKARATFSVSTAQAYGYLQLVRMA